MLNPGDLELAADGLLVELAEVDEEDEVRVALIRDQCLEYLSSAPADATFDGMTRDDAIFVLNFAKKHGSLLTAGQLRDRVRSMKGDLARRESS